MRRRAGPALALALAPLAVVPLVVAPAAAHDVSLVGGFGDKALLTVDGQGPRALGPGQSWHGVRVLRVGDGTADIDDDGRTRELRIGVAPVALGGAAAPRVVLQAQPNGQFVVDARINGQLVPTMVDTGATLVTLGAAQARALGVSLAGATPTTLRTANGAVPGMVVRLASVRVGGIEQHDVPAVVTAGSLPIALLGMSFLRHVDLQRTQEQLVLSARP